MAGKFEFKPFSHIDLADPFFDTLKKDYPEFAEFWFPKCVQEGRGAWVFNDEKGLGAFIALKEENEEIPLEGISLPACPRLKVSTLRLAERFRGQRLGEGALGLILWIWKQQPVEEIYLTIFPEHQDLITQVERFGFINVGRNRRGENVYLRSKKSSDFSDPYKSFPFISPDFEKGGYLIVDDNYHDTLFPYSELKNEFQERLNKDVANGITKIYIGKQWQTHYKVGEPVFIYRKHQRGGQPRYRSCVTSYCVVSDVIAVKRNNRAIVDFGSYKAMIGNKSVFSDATLRERYEKDRNVTVIKLLYCGYFGAGKNVNMDWLDRHGLWSINGGYPANTQLTKSQCELIFEQGKVSIDKVYGR